MSQRLRLLIEYAGRPFYGWQRQEGQPTVQGALERAAAALNGGEAEGTSGALNFLIRQPLGSILLGVTAAGLFAYTLWRLVDGVLDLENEGDDLEGYANRAGQIMSGLTHAALGISAIIILMKGAQASGGPEGSQAEFVPLCLNFPLEEPFA